MLFQYRELWELLHCGGFCSFKTGIPSGYGLYGYQYAGYTIRYDTIGEFNVDWKAEYSALSSTRSQKNTIR